MIKCCCESRVDIHTKTSLKFDLSTSYSLVDLAQPLQGINLPKFGNIFFVYFQCEVTVKLKILTFPRYCFV